MTEHKITIQDPQEAQGHTHAAIKSAVETQTAHVHSAAENANGVLGYANIYVPDSYSSHGINISYDDPGLSYDAEEPTDGRKTEVSVGAGKAKYKATIDHTARSEILNNFRTAASVERKGYGRHEFTEENKHRAGALITSLAARRVAEYAAEDAAEDAEKQRASKL